jgi:hypothetical protein
MSLPDGAVLGNAPRDPGDVSMPSARILVANSELDRIARCRASFASAK